MKLTKGILFEKYNISFNEDEMCSGDHRYKNCHCVFSISVGLPSETGQLCWKWHDNPDWRKCVSLIEWLSGMICVEDCGPTFYEDDFAGHQDTIHVVG